jgi:hypothetical protein
MSETRILIGLLPMYIPQNWEFGPAFSKLRNFGGGLNPQTTPLGTPVIMGDICSETVSTSKACTRAVVLQVFCGALMDSATPFLFNDIAKYIFITFNTI